MLNVKISLYKNFRGYIDGFKRIRRAFQIFYTYFNNDHLFTLAFVKNKISAGVVGISLEAILEGGHRASERGGVERIPRHLARY